MKKRILPYKKMIEAIDNLVDNDWGFDMIDGHFRFDRKTTEAIDIPYKQSEAKEMATVLGRIYMIAHCVHCKACTPNLEF